MPEVDLTFQIDDSLDWTDHFVEHGFAVAKGLIDHQHPVILDTLAAAYAVSTRQTQENREWRMPDALAAPVPAGPQLRSCSHSVAAMETTTTSSKRL